MFGWFGSPFTQQFWKFLIPDINCKLFGRYLCIQRSVLNAHIMIVVSQQIPRWKNLQIKKSWAKLRFVFFYLFYFTSRRFPCSRSRFEQRTSKCLSLLFIYLNVVDGLPLVIDFSFMIQFVYGPLNMLQKHIWMLFDECSMFKVILCSFSIFHSVVVELLLYIIIFRVHAVDMLLSILNIKLISKRINLTKKENNERAKLQPDDLPTQI